MAEAKPIFIGMHRPPWGWKTPTCSLMCTCGGMIHAQNQLREHWQAGHFDEPIYLSAEEAAKRLLKEILDRALEAKE